MIDIHWSLAPSAMARLAITSGLPTLTLRSKPAA